MDSLGLRRMLGQFVTGVTVVTARHEEGYECVTVNSFNSVSLDPPLVLFSLHSNSSLLSCFEQADRFGISILERNNESVSRLFAGPQRHRWKECNVETGRHGALLVQGALARMECEPWAAHDGGDHRIFICRVLDFDYDDSGTPLAYFRGRYCQVGEVTAQARTYDSSSASCASTFSTGR